MMPTVSAPIDKNQNNQDFPRFILGIDLGTTNSTVSLIDTEKENWAIETFMIPQWVRSQQIESLEYLPSFHFQPEEPFLEFPWSSFGLTSQDKNKSNDFSVKTASETSQKNVTDNLSEKNGFSRTQKKLDFQKIAVGVFARDNGIHWPHRFISSAKSWLCHKSVDRTAPILPWNISSDESQSENSDPSNIRQNPMQKCSPLDVSAAYLAHIRHCWNWVHPDYPMEEQQIILTLPASFDEVARELTVLAAQKAGLPKIILIEEPQAAFYCWIDQNRETWSEQVRPDQKILICDVGGGTTDLTLLRVHIQNNTSCSKKTQNSKTKYLNTQNTNIPSLNTQNLQYSNVQPSKTQKQNDQKADDFPSSEKLQFHRVAVGEHLILGGDNLDLAIAHYLEQRLLAKKAGNKRDISSRIWTLLIRLGCEIKEHFLSDPNLDQTTVNIPGLGSKLIGGGIRLDIPRTDIEQIILDGFFPIVPLTAKPDRKRVGLREAGLPYAQDPALTKYLADFLSVHRFAGCPQDISASSAVSSNSTASSNSAASSSSTTSSNSLNSLKTEYSSDSPDSFDSSDSKNTEYSSEFNSSSVSVPNSAFDPARPDVVLFNGGMFRSKIIRDRIIQSLEHWFRTESDPTWTPLLFENVRYDLAVSRGAAYYGMVQRGLGERISASLARTYYIGIRSLEGKTQLLTLLPAQTEPEEEVRLTQRRFQLLVNQPVSFPFYVSSVRLTDLPGSLIDFNPLEISELPPLQTVIKKKNQHRTLSDSPLFPPRQNNSNSQTNSAQNSPISQNSNISAVQNRTFLDKTLQMSKIDKTVEIETSSDAPSSCCIENGQIPSNNTDSVQVELSGYLSEIGTLAIFVNAVDSDQPDNIDKKDIEETNSKTSLDKTNIINCFDKRNGIDPSKTTSWKLELDVRCATETDQSGHFSDAETEGVLDELLVEKAESVLLTVFGENPTLKPSSAVQMLEKQLGLKKEELPSSLLRRMGEFLMNLESARRRKPEIEARWLNLLGFAYRPGFGFAMDDWRISQVWKILSGTLVHSVPAVRIQYWILWRRIAGGLTAGQQKTLTEPVLTNVRALVKQVETGRGKGSDLDLSSQEGAEIWRMLGAMEKIAPEQKTETGDLILSLVFRKKYQAVADAMFWALGRLGARHPFAGPSSSVVSPIVAERWIDVLIQKDVNSSVLPLTLMQLARKTNDRTLDISENIRTKVRDHLVCIGAAPHLLTLIDLDTDLEKAEQNQIFGESLPLGLTLIS